MRATIAVLLLQLASSLYFFITDGQQRCFIEEVPAETLIVGTYKNPDFVPFGKPEFTGVVSSWLDEPLLVPRCCILGRTPRLRLQGLKLVVQDPNSNVVMTKPVDVEGKFAFTSAMGGEYLLCFSTNSS